MLLHCQHSHRVDSTDETREDQTFNGLQRMKLSLIRCSVANLKIPNYSTEIRFINLRLDLNCKLKTA